MTAPNMRLCASWADEYGQSTSVILMIFCNLAVIKKVIPKGSLWDGQASDRNSNSQSSQSPDRCVQPSTASVHNSKTNADNDLLYSHLSFIYQLHKSG